MYKQSNIGVLKMRPIPPLAGVGMSFIVKLLNEKAWAEWQIKTHNLLGVILDQPFDVRQVLTAHQLP